MARIIVLKNIIITLLFIGVYGCNKYPPSINDTLKKSGKNKKELLSVIEHYKKTKETQKLEAVYFLYSNMSAKFHLEGTYYDSLQPFYNYISNNVEYQNAKKTNQEYLFLKQVADSVLNIHSSLRNRLKFEYDSKKLSSSFLIDNIDKAFEVWENVKWKDLIDFSTFLNFILPYKISTESSTNWRSLIVLKYPELYKKVKAINNIDTAFYFLNKKIETEFLIRFPFELGNMSFDKNFNHYNSLKMGDCTDATNYTLFFMRTYGIPTAFDYLLAWGNSGSKHSWVKLIKPNNDNKTTLITNINNRENTNNIVSESFYDCPINKLIDNDDIQYKRTVPKVYRKMFSLQDNLKKLNKTFPKEMHDNFKNFSLKDVSDEYLDCGSVVIKIERKHKNAHLIYLCVFSTNGWVPIDIKLVEKNKVTFDKIGKNVMYLPMSYVNNKLKPVGNPFSVSRENTKKSVNFNINNTQTVTLKRKHPLFARIAHYANTMYKAKFTISKTNKFTDTINIQTIEKTSIIPTYFDVSIPEGYNYLKFTPPNGHRVVFSELEFFYRENGSLKKLERKEYKLLGPYVNVIDKLFDNKFGTIVNSPPFTLKFLNPTKKIVKMRYCPRSDTNFVEPNDNYELLYWSNEWVSLGVNKATNFSIVFNNVPKNALLWLRDITKGKEERIFTYRNNNQIWW